MRSTTSGSSGGRSSAMAKAAARRAASSRHRASSWTWSVAGPGAADPGVPPGPAGAGLYVSEIADPGATGAYVYEYVEITWDP